MEHYYLSDQEFAKRFADLTLNPEFFNHVGHIRLVWIHLRKSSLSETEAILCKQIAQFDATFWGGMRYNEPLTLAAIRLIHACMSHSPHQDFTAFIRDYPRLRFQFAEWLQEAYDIPIELTALP